MQNIEFCKGVKKERDCMKTRLKYLLLPVVTLILEILPCGAVCIFATSPTETARATFSYFDLLPFGYANFTPFITAIITCIISLLLVIYCFTGKEQLARTAKNILCVGIVVSFVPLLFGIAFFSIVGLLISLLLIGEFLLLRCSTKASN